MTSSWTKVPRPCSTRTRPPSSSVDMARRTVLRLTPNLSTSSGSVGSLVPGGIVPSVISAASCSPICCQRAVPDFRLSMPVRLIPLAGLRRPIRASIRAFDPRACCDPTGSEHAPGSFVWSHCLRRTGAHFGENAPARQTPAPSGKQTLRHSSARVIKIQSFLCLNDNGSGRDLGLAARQGHSDMRRTAVIDKLAPKHQRAVSEMLANPGLDRREFVRTLALLGMSAASAYGLAGLVDPAGQSAAAQGAGGTVRIAMPVTDVSRPHAAAATAASNIYRQVVEYLTVTGPDNVTRPCLLESWSPSEDLRTWTLHLRRDVKWRDGRQFVADDVVWNLRHVLADATGSSVVSLMKAYMLEDVTSNGQKGTKLWREDAIEKLDHHTVRLNLKSPQLAVPEHLFHYPLAMLDPK